MPIRYTWRIRCQTESAWVPTDLWTEDGEPTECPNNPAHTIVPSATKITTTVRDYPDSRDPTVDDDTTIDYVENDRWTNSSSGSEFLCLNPEDGSADWQKTSMATDEMSKVSADDTTTAFLWDKLTVTAPVTRTEVNPGGDEAANVGVSDLVGDSGSGGTRGTVPAPAAGDAAAGKFLKADGTWTVPSGGGSAKVFDVFGPDTDGLYPSSSPARASRNGHPVWAFDDVVDESIILTGVMGPGYGAGNLDVNIQWAADGVITGNVKWNVEWERMDTSLDLDADSWAAAQTATTSAPSIDGTTAVTTITCTQAQAGGITAGDAYRIRVTRDADDAGDTLAADAQAIRLTIEEQ